MADDFGGSDSGDDYVDGDDGDEMEEIEEGVDENADQARYSTLCHVAYQLT